MSADRRSWLSRRRGRVEAEPDVVVEEMEAATQRLREQAWKLNATTRARLIPEEEARPEAPERTTGRTRKR